MKGRRLLRGFRRWVPVHRHMAGLIDDTIEPGTDRREFVEREIALVRKMRITIQRYVGDRVVAGGEEVVRREMLRHHAEGLVALLHPVLERVHLQLASAFDQGEPEEGGPEIRLQTVLLEEHPLQRRGAIDAILRRERRAARDVPEDG